MKLFYDSGAWHTKNCVRHPNRKAVTWGGHVIKKKDVSKKRRMLIIAGWCNRRCSDTPGFCGLV